MRRRQFLATVTGVAMAGCNGLLGGGRSDGRGSGSTSVDTRASSPTPAATPSPSKTPTATTTPTPPSTPHELAYDDFFHDFEAYEGKPVRFEYGYVYRVQHRDQYDRLRMHVSNSQVEWEGRIAGEWTGNTRVAGDELNPVVGVAEQLVTYTTDGGYEHTIPYLSFTTLDLWGEEPETQQ
ncbi:hypothetical protein [Halosimplex salinum]|uniref:hypothetical protein n=1 Tax=Halosimplex salinum TaxID=1710538 RepID=UPI000F49D3D6|nr:hypothetical protein [Halosimplex salinum]